MPEPSGIVILVAEDHDLVRRLIIHLLARKGYEVIEANGGVQALQRALAAGRVIDLLLTDVVMPDMGGVELAIAVRSHWPAVKVVMMSGFPLNLQEALDGFIRKPFIPAQLWRVLENALGPVGGR